MDDTRPWKPPKGWKPADDGEITPAELHQILGDYHEGDPDPEQMERILLWFADLVGNLNGVTYRVIVAPPKTKGATAPIVEHRKIPEAFFEYLREAIYRRLRPKQAATATGKRARRRAVSADQALGVNRPPKRPKRSESNNLNVAREMLLRRLKGDSWREGATYLQSKLDLSTKEIENLARVHIGEAIMAERVIRSLKDRPFSIQEQKVIARIEKKVNDRINKKAMAIAERDVLVLPVHPVFRK